MTPTEIAAIVVRLDTHQELLHEIRDDVRATNGRLRGVERWQSRIIGAGVTLTTLLPVAVAVIVATAT